MRRSLILTTALMTLTALPVAAEQRTLVVSYAPTSLGDIYEEVADAFMAAHPDVTIELRGVESYEPLVQQTLRDNIADDLADVSHQGNNWIRIFVDRGLAQSLEPFIAAEANWDSMGYLPSMQEICSFRGATYCLPFSISAPVFYYNLDLVTAAGGDPDDLPDTWDEILALAKAVDALSPETMGIFYDYQASGAFAFQALLFGQGGSMMNADESQIAFDGPEGLWALELLHRLGDEAGQLDMSREQARQAFFAGTIGMYANTNSLLTRALEESSGRFALRMAAQPIEPEIGRRPAAGNAVVMLTDDPERQALAWEYIKFATGPIGQTILVENSGYAPTNMIAAEDPAYLGQFYKENPNYRVTIDMLPELTGWYAFPGENAIPISDMIRDHMQAVITLQMTPEDAMAAMVAEARAMLPSN